MRDNAVLPSWQNRGLEVKETEVLILGSGIAGLFAALKLHERYQVIVLTKKKIMDSNTEHAQGGIAVALNGDDSPDFHYGDTIKAGAGLCNLEAVKILAEKGPECLRELIGLGAQFDMLGDQLDFTKEGAHSKKRILHAKGDATGYEIQRALVAAVRQRQIPVMEDCFVMEILKNEQEEATGVLALMHLDGKPVIWLAKAIVVAAGGLGQLYQYTTNPEVTTGDGIAAAYRAGAELMDMEFIQFHPTALSLPGRPSFLISEATRGEGAKLINGRGERFMVDVPLQELAPRDVVARAIWQQMKEGPVYLDLTSLDASQVQTRFPSIYKTCLDFGIDPSTELVPVSPAAHYHMGGIRVDSIGQTSIPRLYACGECACNGVHGANRLASNSLLDGIVFASIISEHLLAKEALSTHREDLAPLQSAHITEKGPSATAQEVKTQMQRIMWDQVGIIRDEAQLIEANGEIRRLKESFRPSSQMADLELENMLTLCLCIIDAALARRESRGGHYRADYPNPLTNWQKHSVMKRGEPVVSFVAI